jgi:hypothetical protein
MSSSLPNTIIVRHEPEKAVSPFHILVLASLSLGVIVWAANSIFGGEGLQYQRYLALLAFYAAGSTVFVLSRIQKGKLQLFEIPVYLTAMAFLQFGLAPLRNFIDPSQIDLHLSENGEDLVQALLYCIIGMIAFWAGCQAARRKQGGQMSSGLGKEDAVPASRQPAILLSTVALFAVGFITKFYLLRSHLYSYATSMDKYYANLASMQVLIVLGQFGTFALAVAAIERFRKGSRPIWRVLFLAIFCSEVLWSAISGMKGLIFQNFLLVALVSSIVQRRLNLRWLVLPIFGLVLLYPVYDAYRGLIRGRGVQVTSFQEAGRAGQMALQDATPQSAKEGGLWSSGQMMTVKRLDLLTCVAQVLTLGSRASLMKGDVRWWMLPIYPFVPRFMWRSKPILNEGGMFTLALRGGSGTADTAGSSTAVTYLGDLYLRFGLVGVLVGMFLLGIVAQSLTNLLTGRMERQHLFIYILIFLDGFPYESDVFLLWVTLAKFLAILYVVSRLVYGPRSPRRGPLPPPPVPARQRRLVYGPSSPRRGPLSPPPAPARQR